MPRANTNPIRAALRGALFLLPFAITNAIVANQVEPFLSLLRPTGHTSAREYVVLAIVLLLIPVGAFLAAKPMFGPPGPRRFYPVNALLAVLLCTIFVAISFGLGSDIYHCDVLRIPNCD